MKPSSNVEQRSSTLLTKDENDQIFNLLGPKCQALSTTVVQLYSTEGPDGTHWMKKDIGVLCLVRDINRRSYFFRLFCTLRNRMIWEHEIYNSMQYLAPKPFLHTFEAEERIVAFNFASDEEAAHMRGILLEKLKTKEQKRLERRKIHGRNSVTQAPSRPAPTPNAVSNGYVYPKSIPSKSFSLSKQSKKTKKKSITKADIGNPQNFRHVSHVGWDPTTGFDLENVDKSMRKFFEKVGISENDLKDKETREFIYDFIEKHGGLDAVKQDIHHQSILPPPSPPPPPPVPSRNVAPSTNFRPAPPPPPSRNASAAHPAPPPPPSDPPPVNVMMQRSHDQFSKKTPSNAAAPTNSVPPPPPPPPPLPPPNAINEGNGVSNSVVSSNSNSAAPPALPDPRNALMEAIRSGTTLKHVETDPKKTDDSRGELLNEIRRGVELKSVQPVEKSAQGSLPVDGLAGALARALAERSRVIHSDSSDTNDSDDSDSDEWG